MISQSITPYVAGHRQTGQRGCHQLGQRLAVREPLLLGLGALGHAAVLLQQERTDRVDPHLLGRTALGQQVSDQTAGAYVLDPRHHRHVPFLRHPHRSPATRSRDQQQHRQQHRVQDGQDARRGDQGDRSVECGHARTDHAPGGGGPELGHIDQAAELRILDRLQLDHRGRSQVLRRRDPLHQRLQTACPRRGQTGEAGIHHRDHRADHQRGQSSTQPVDGIPAPEQRVHHGVDRQQTHGRRDALPDLAHTDDQQRRLVRRPCPAQRTADQPGHGADRREHGQIQSGMLVLGKTQVVAQRPAEQLLFGCGDHRLDHPDTV